MPRCFDSKVVVLSLECKNESLKFVIQVCFLNLTMSLDKMTVSTIQSLLWITS